MRSLLLFLLAVPVWTQPELYRFAVDQDAVAGAPDFSWLNQPLGPEHRVFIRDGHFFTVGPDLEANTDDDRRVVFWGVNLAFGANFPVPEDAVRVAKRLRRLGVNIVRLHHMDSQPDRTPGNAGSLLTTGPYPTLNQVAVERLRRLIDALKSEGIYVNLNLHVGYQFRPGVDGVPAVDGGMPNQSKPLHMIHPRMIELQAEYARKVISALALKDDPALAMVEINNESSLVWQWQAGQLQRYLVGEYRDTFSRQWNAFLGRKYSGTEALREAWSGGDPDGPELLTGQWVVENHTSLPVGMAMQTGGSRTLRIDAPQAGAPIIIKQIGFSISIERPYIAEVEMRADVASGASRSIYWDVKKDTSPWTTIASRNVTVSSEWQKYRMVVTPTFELDQVGRFAVSIENVGAPVYLRNWHFFQAGRRTLSDGETVEDANIALVADDEIPTEARLNDYLRFLADQDRAYLRTMLDAVRDSTDSLVPVAGTQTDFGGLLNYDSHEDLGYQDHHFYVDHYNFPNTAWDGRDWRMRDQSHIGSGLPAFLRAAASRQAGRPYTLSEFNQPWPNTYAAEIDPTLAAFGRFQDWDGVMHFAYSHGRNWDDNVQNGFNVNGDWTKWPAFGQAAWLFRSSALQAGADPLMIPVSEDMRLRATRERRNANIPDFLRAAMGFDPNTALVRRLALAKDAEGEIPEAARAVPASPFASDTGQIGYDSFAKIFTVQSPTAAGVFGIAGRQKITAGAIDVELTGNARGFVALLATALDGQEIGQPGRVLISNPGYTLRTQPGSSPERPQQIVNYPGTDDWWTVEPDTPSKPSGNLNGGQRPAWMERVEVFVSLRATAENITVFLLDGAGSRASEMPASDIERIDGGYRIHLQSDGQMWTPWFEVVLE